MKFIPRRLKRTADNSRGKLRWKDWIKGLGSVAIVLGIVYLLLGFVADSVANSVSEETEARWFSWIELGDAQAEDNAGFTRAQACFDRLIGDPELRPLPYQLVWLRDDAPNAFALPGGLVGVTQGLLDLVDSEIGIAFVLAHELGHHQNRHALKRLGRILVTHAAVTLASGAANLSVLDNGLTFAGLAHTRGQEREADRFGLDLVHRTYGTTEGAFEFFEVVHEIQGDGSRLGNMLHSHPLTEDRIADLQARAATLPVTAPRELHAPQRF
jgi:Zn-dependent protease with chaperone function